MRLLIVIPALVSYTSFLRELCRSLVADGAEVHLACSPEKLWDHCDSVGRDGVHLHAIDFPRGMNPAAHLRAARALNRLVEKLRPDFVHVNFSAAIFTTALARTERWPVTHATFHGVAFLAMSGWKSALLRVMEAWAARRCDVAWVLTDDDRERLSAAAPRANVRRLPGFGVGCDIGKFQPLAPCEREARRAELGFARDHVVFVFVGRFVNFKGFGQAVRAFFRVAETHNTVRLLLIGSGDPLHPTGLTATEEEALRASLLVHDVGFRNDVERFLPAADVMVFASHREGMPVCLMEALAAGVPAITRDARGSREVVRDGVDGWVLQDCTDENLANAMTKLANDPATRREMAARALEGRERFARARFVAEQTRIYETSLQTSGQSVAVEGVK